MVIISQALLHRTKAKWMRCSLIGQVLRSNLTDDQVITTIRSEWGLFRDLDIAVIRPNLFVFNFRSENDCAQKLEQQPWCINVSYLLLLKPFALNVNPVQVSIENFTFKIWIWFKGLELEHRCVEIVGDIARDAGVVHEIDDSRGNKGFRVRVEVPVDQPLVRGTFVNVSNGPDVWVKFVYDCLPKVFCIRCFLVGHTRAQCPVVDPLSPPQVVVPPPGPDNQGGNGGAIFVADPPPPETPVEIDVGSTSDFSPESESTSPDRSPGPQLKRTQPEEATTQESEPTGPNNCPSSLNKRVRTSTEPNIPIRNTGETLAGNGVTDRGSICTPSQLSGANLQAIRAKIGFFLSYSNSPPGVISISAPGMQSGEFVQQHQITPDQLRERFIEGYHRWLASQMRQGAQVVQTTESPSP